MKKHLTIYFTSDTHGYFPAVDYATGKTAATGVVNRIFYGVFQLSKRLDFFSFKNLSDPRHNHSPP